MTSLFLTVITNNVDFREKNFLEAALLTILGFVAITLLPHLQYKYKLLSKILGCDMSRSADFLAYALIHIGTFKNYAFFEALFTNKQFDVSEWYYYTVYPLSVVMISLGTFLTVLSFRRLGLRGMYFGDHFGFLLKDKVVKFPYNYFENPQYIGSILIYFGLSFAFRSLAGILLTLFVMIMYNVCWIFYERKKLRKFYPEYRTYNPKVDELTDDEDKKKIK